MKIAQPGSNPSSNTTQCSRVSQRLSLGVFTALAVVLSLGASPAANAQSGGGRIGGPSGGEVAGAAIGVGAGIAVVVAVVISHSHHVMSGCVLTGPNGLELQTGDKTYALEGDSNGIKAGERVKVHGSKAKKTKGATGHEVFTVDSLKKDYGTCHVEHATSAL
jgi:hypothetical protein